MIQLQFESKLNTTTKKAWQWIISKKGINKELFPFIRMTNLKKLETNSFKDLQPGIPICHNWLLFFYIIPIDILKLTIIEAVEEKYFIEQSQMFSMKLWRHERYVLDSDDHCIVRDVLSFEPKLFSKLMALFVKILFLNRHRNLRKYFGY